MKHDGTQRRLYDLFLEKEYRRRTFLQGVAAAATGTALGGCRRRWPVIDSGSPPGSDSGSPPGIDSGSPPGTDAGSPPGTDAGTDSGPPLPQGLVGAGEGVGTPDTLPFVETALGRALDHSLGGLAFVSPGDEVFVKINMNSGNPFPYTCNTITIAALKNALDLAGASRVVFGDRSFFGANSAANAIASGIQAAVLGAGAEWMILDENDPSQIWLEIPQTQAPDWSAAFGASPGTAFRIPGIYSTMDHVIHLAILKTHFIAHYTMTVKLGFGSVYAADRQVNLSPHVTSGGVLWRQIAQVGASYTPSLHLLDAQQPVITGGPDTGSTANNFEWIFASTDPIAIDATGLAALHVVGSPEPDILNYGVWGQPQLIAGINRGLGITAPTAYSLEGTGNPTQLDAVRTWALTG